MLRPFFFSNNSLISFSKSFKETPANSSSFIFSFLIFLINKSIMASFAIFPYCIFLPIPQTAHFLSVLLPVLLLFCICLQIPLFYALLVLVTPFLVFQCI